MPLKILLPIGPYTSITPILDLDKYICDFKHSEITIFSVIEIPFVTSLEQDEIKRLDIYTLIKSRIDEVVKILDDMGVSSKVKIVYSRSVDEAIVEEALSGQYDLIVLIKRRKPPRILGKSISRSVLSKIPVPLLILTMD